jgi:DNA-binding response OmpR family regulator
MNTAKKILIIDDDLDFQLMVGKMLQDSGYDVKSLLEGKMEAARTAATGCDIVLLDIELPGVTGVTIGRDLKSFSETLHIPIILVSGHCDCEQMFTDSGADAMFRKPFSLSGLSRKIKELLSVKRIDSQGEEFSSCPVNHTPINTSWNF